MENIDYDKQLTTTDSKSIKERELKCSHASFVFSSSIITVSDDGDSCKKDTREMDNSAIFAQNYKYWNQQVGFSSANNLDNDYFKSIVDMGVDAVPYILKELEKGPSLLVHALDLIFPGVMKYEGFVSLEEACNKWISILK
jgi:hypothetical protein